LLTDQDEISNLYQGLKNLGPPTWWEAPMEGSVLSFLKAE
jgi:hypothetical protein